MKSLITKNPKIQFGRATIRGTRILAGVIKSYYLAGESIEMLCNLYDLSEEQVRAAINFKSKVKI